MNQKRNFLLGFFLSALVFLCLAASHILFVGGTFIATDNNGTNTLTSTNLTVNTINVPGFFRTGPNLDTIVETRLTFSNPVLPGNQLDNIYLDNNGSLQVTDPLNGGAIVLTMTNFNILQSGNFNFSGIASGNGSNLTNLQGPNLNGTVTVTNLVGNGAGLTNISSATNLTRGFQIDLYSNNVARVNGVLTNFPASTTSGLQECVDLLTNYGGGVIQLASPVPYYTSDLILMNKTIPFFIEIRGLGLEVNGVVYTGNAGGAVVFYLNGVSSLNLGCHFHDMYLSSVNNYAGLYLIFLNNFNRAQIDHMWFGPWLALTNHQTIGGATVGNTTFVIGGTEYKKNIVPISFSSNPADVAEITGCSFLSCAAMGAEGDHVILDNNMFTDCGALGANNTNLFGAAVPGTQFNMHTTDLPASSQFACGEAVYFANAQANSNRKCHNNHFYYCSAGYMTESSGSFAGRTESYDDTFEAVPIRVLFSKNGQLTCINQSAYQDGGSIFVRGIFMDLTNSAGNYFFDTNSITDGTNTFDNGYVAIESATNGITFIGKRISALGTNYGNGLGLTNIPYVNLLITNASPGQVPTWNGSTLTMSNSGSSTIVYSTNANINAMFFVLTTNSPANNTNNWTFQLPQPFVDGNGNMITNYVVIPSFQGTSVLPPTTYTLRVIATATNSFIVTNTASVTAGVIVSAFVSTNGTYLTGNPLNMNVTSVTATGSMTNGGTYYGNGNGLSNLNVTVIQTNLVNGKYNTNTSGSMQTYSGSIDLTLAAVSGSATYAILYDTSGGHNFVTNKIVTVPTGVAILTGDDFVSLSGAMFPTNTVWYGTNLSSGAGNSATPVAGTGQLRQDP